MNQSMKALTLNDWGSAQKFELNLVDIPEVNEDDVLVKVAYAGLNPADWKMRSGFLADALPLLKPPYILGLDASGIVVKAGKNVTDLNIGDRVIAGNNLFHTGQPGTYSEYLAVNQMRVSKLSNEVSYSVAATIPTAARTAWQAMFNEGKGNLTEGKDTEKSKNILINGASGGVGSFALQFAKWVGANVITTSSGKNIPYLKSLGADVCIDYQTQNLAEELKKIVPAGVDLVIDAVGANTMSSIAKSVTKGGRIVSIATITQDEEIEQNIQKAKEVGVNHIFAMVDDINMKNEMDKISSLLEKEEIKSPTIQEYPMQDVAKAHDAMEAGQTKGKLVLKINTGEMK